MAKTGLETRSTGRGIGSVAELAKVPPSLGAQGGTLACSATGRARDALRLAELLIRLHNLPHGLLQTHADVPGGIMIAHFPQIGQVANMIADAVFVEVLVDLGFAAELLRQRKSLPDRAGVGAASADVVDLADAGGGDEFPDEAGDIGRMNVVADLFALVTEDSVFAAFKITFHEVGKKAVEFDSAVVGAGEASSAEAARRHAEVAAVFLDHDIGGDFGGAEEGVFALVDGEILADAVLVSGIVVVPAGLELFEGDAVGPVSVDFVRRHVDEGGLGTSLSRRFEEIEGADGVGVKIVKRDRGGPIVRGLRGGVDDGVGSQLTKEGEDALAVADVEFVVVKGGAERFSETMLVVAGVTLRPEKDSALVVVDAMDLPAKRREMDADFRANEAGRAGDEEFHFGEAV